MTTAKTALFNEILTTNNGIVKTETLNKNGFSSRNIQWLLNEGLIVRIKQGLYLGKQDDVYDIELAAKLIPNGVLCLFTAIEHYELATVNPSEISIALPRGVKCPILPNNLFIKIHHMTNSHFEAGISEAEVNGTIVRMYDAEKTVCDCFKYDNEVEKNIALEVLKNYIAGGGRNIQKLLEYAKLLGKKKVIYPYVEALV